MTISNVNAYRSESLMDVSSILENKSNNNLVAKVELVANCSKELCRTLDKYGIDVDLCKMAEVHIPSSPTIIAHKKAEGGIKLETGLYISDPNNGDKYGEFRFHEGRATVKYQVAECTKLEVDGESLDILRDTYHEISGVTNFLRDVLDLKPGKDLAIFSKHPEYFSYLPPVSSSSNGFLIFPNAPYIDLSSLSVNSTELKDRREGICLGAYAIHPNQNLSLIEKMGVATGFVDENIKEDYADNSRTLSDIEAGTKVKYLASILDLDSADVLALEALRSHIFEHLSEVYGVDSQEDKVQLYFHFPPADVTATLHLHVRINVADHPLNQARSFEMSDVIDVLKGGGTINDLVLSRNDGVLYTLVSETDSIRVIPNKSKSDNPFALELA